MRDALTPLVMTQSGAVADELVLLLQQQRRRCAAPLAELTGQLAELLGVGQRLEHRVLTLQHGVPLVQLLDLLLQHLHLLANSIHQMALHQILGEKTRKWRIKIDSSQGDKINVHKYFLYLRAHRGIM